MAEITLILGGARSGKSNYALEEADKYGKKVAFVATCTPCDEEMAERIRLHKSRRPAHWKTFEEPRALAALLDKIGAQFDAVVIDCLTLFESNLLSDGLSDEAVEKEICNMLKALRSARCKSIIISNEVGLGVVPQNQLARRFRDLAGRLNQLVAKEADEVFFMASGIPITMKGAKRCKD